MNARTTARPAIHAVGAFTARPAGRRRGVALAAAVLAVLALTGCRGGAQGAAGSARSGDTGTPVSTGISQPGSTGTTGAGSGSGSVAGDLDGIDEDLKGLSSADSAIGNDLGAAASEGAQPDNG